MKDFKEKVIKWLSQNLKKADINTPVKAYAENSVKFSAIPSILVFTLFALIEFSLLDSIVFSLIFFILNLVLWTYYPILKKNKKRDLIEKDLPFALMNLSVELNIENRFEKALLKISQNNHSVLGKELRRTLREIADAGVSIQHALINLTKRVESDTLKRAVMKIITIYEQGGTKKLRGEPIRSIAKEELSIQKAKIREFSHKLVIYSLMFIVISAVFPAFFQAFIIVGSTFMRIEFSALQVLLIITIIFPIFDLAVLFYIKSKTPQFLR